MGNATASCRGKLKTTRPNGHEYRRVLPIKVDSLFFFILLILLLPVSSFSQDLSAYAEMLRSGNTEEKREALFQLRNLRSEAASRIAAVSLSDKAPIVRATAASSVLFLPKVDAANALLPLIKDKDPFVRREGAFALGEVGDISAAPQLISALTRDKDPEVRTASAVALGKVGEPAAVATLAGLFSVRPTEENEMLRSATAKSIGQIAEKIRADKVTKLTPQNFLPDKYKDLGSKSMPSLLTFFDNAEKTLARVLESTSEADDTRREAAFALGAIGDVSGEPILSKFTSSSDPYLAEICREALMKIKALE